MNWLTEFEVRWVGRAAFFALLMHAAFPAVAAEDKEYIVGVQRPNNLFVIDADTLEVTQNCNIPGRMAPGHLTLSPDNEVAYVLGDGGSILRGISLSTCELVFQALLTRSDVRGRALAAVSVSRDGQELYVGVNRVRHLSDELQALPPLFTVFSTQDGLNSKPIRSFGVPGRPLNYIMDVGADGTVYGITDDLFSINPKTGETQKLMKLSTHQAPLETQLWFGSSWNTGQATGDYIVPYSQMKFADDNYDPATAEMVVGYVNVELETGQVSRKEMGSYVSSIVSGARNPRNRNQFIGGFSELMQYDVKKKKLLKSIKLDHTYHNFIFSTRGDRVYVSGSLSDLAVYDAETLEKVGQIDLPAGGDMALAQIQVFTKPQE